MLPRPPSSTLFPYTTLFRSRLPFTVSLHAFPLRTSSTSLVFRRARPVASPHARPRESALDAGCVPGRPNLPDGARPPSRWSGDGLGAPEPARRLLRVPARGEPRRPADLEGANGLTLGRSPGADRRPGPALRRADARRRAGPGGGLQTRGVGQRRAARPPRAPARLSQRVS